MPVEVIDETGASPDAQASARSDASEVPTPLGASAERIAEAILGCLGREDAELSVAFVGDERMRELNRQWRGKDSTTDVLSFSQIEDFAGDLEIPGGHSDPTGELFEPGEESNGDEPESGDESEAPAMLGDVVISVPVLERQAADGGWTVDEELARLLLHGVLHLLGFDHEEDADARRMRAEEGRLVAALAERGIPCAWEGDDA